MSNTDIDELERDLKAPDAEHGFGVHPWGPRGQTILALITELRQLRRALGAPWPDHVKRQPGDRVVSDDYLESNHKRGFQDGTFRVPHAEGVVIAYHDSHGLSYEVRHKDGVIGHYDDDELRDVLEAAQP
jgi:hypothetical protein